MKSNERKPSRDPKAPRKATRPLSDPRDREPDPSLERPGHAGTALDTGNPQAHADGSVSIVRESSGNPQRS